MRRCFHDFVVVISNDYGGVGTRSYLKAIEGDYGVANMRAYILFNVGCY